MIESLESRTLFSANPVVTADLGVIRAQIKVVRSELTILQKTAVADVNLLKKDLQRLDEVKADRSLLNAINLQERPDLALLKTEANKLMNGGLNLVNKVVGDYNRLRAHPSSVVVQAKFNSDVTVLQSNISLAQTEVSSRGSVVVTDADYVLDALAGANASDVQTQTDVATAKADISTNDTAVVTGLTLLFSDVSTLVGAMTT